ncbi:transcriptional regulator [Escherichia coli APEC O18]|nr:transcriptional regulator [Escherichia coli APEC O18]BEU30366.1 hypothetical protein GU2018CL13_14300 [Escherichia coli]GCN87856.1 hypothetical protein ExPCM12_00798 [Escherichia coli]STN16847.1 Arc-like DNA binding domain protein [Escherichia coli]
MSIDYQCVPKYYVCVPHTAEDAMKVKTLRMPEKLEKILEEKAKEECRSFSAEVIKRVLDSLKREGVMV